MTQLRLSSQVYANVAVSFAKIQYNLTKVQNTYMIILILREKHKLILFQYIVLMKNGEAGLEKSE